jgi:hypothetical protein
VVRLLKEVIFHIFTGTLEMIDEDSSGRYRYIWPFGVAVLTAEVM